MKTNYTSRTMSFFRDAGWAVWKVEQWNQYARIRQDMFGIIDLVAICPGAIAGIQSTSYPGRKAHKDKILAAWESLAWTLAGGQLWLVSWKKVKKVRGGKAFSYEPVVDCFDKGAFTHLQSLLPEGWQEGISEPFNTPPQKLQVINGGKFYK